MFALLTWAVVEELIGRPLPRQSGRTLSPPRPKGQGWCTLRRLNLAEELPGVDDVVTAGSAPSSSGIDGMIFSTDGQEKSSSGVQSGCPCARNTDERPVSDVPGVAAGRHRRRQ
ncbi:hypothetical protein XF35_17465 [Streptomyces platensis subsp. clarensis]|nr:hypothetical protein [Streptomyces platensis subsp. clarensis]